MATDNVKSGRGHIYVETTIKDPEGFKQYTALSWRYCCDCHVWRVAV